MPYTENVRDLLLKKQKTKKRRYGSIKNRKITKDTGQVDLNIETLNINIIGAAPFLLLAKKKTYKVFAISIKDI